MIHFEIAKECIICNDPIIVQLHNRICRLNLTGVQRVVRDLDGARGPRDRLPEARRTGTPLQT